MVIANGVDLSTYAPDRAEERAALRAQLGLEPNRCYGVFVGRLHPVKSVDTLVRALVDTTGIDLLIVGDGQERAPLEAARAASCASARGFGSSAAPARREVLEGRGRFLPSVIGRRDAERIARGDGVRAPLRRFLERRAASKNFSGTRAASRSPSATSRAWSEVMQRLTSDRQLRHTSGEAAAPVCASASLHRCDS